MGATVSMFGLSSASEDAEMASQVFEACRDGDNKTLEDLITAGADLSIFNEDGVSPLHMTAEIGHSDCVMTLLMAGMDPNLEDKTETPIGLLRMTPLHVAAAEGWRL